MRDRIAQKKFYTQDSSLALRLTVSIGVASFPEHSKSKEELLQVADEMMYCGKHRGKNQVVTAPRVGELSKASGSSKGAGDFLPAP